MSKFFKQQSQWSISRFLVSILLVISMLCMTACIFGPGEKESTSDQESTKDSYVESQIEDPSESESEIEEEPESETSYSEESEESEEESESDQDSEPEEAQSDMVDISDLVFERYIYKPHFTNCRYWNDSILIQSSIYDGSANYQKTVLDLYDLNTQEEYIVEIEPWMEYSGFTSDGYFCYYYVEDSIIYIVLLNRHLEVDSVFPLEGIECEPGMLDMIWLDDNTKTLAFGLTNRCFYYVDLQDGTYAVFKDDVYSVRGYGNRKLYYFEKNKLMSYDFITTAKEWTGLYYTERCREYNSYYKVSVSSPCSHSFYKAYQNWNDLNTWNVFIDDNTSSNMIGMCGNIMIVDSPIYDDFYQPPIERTIYAIDCETGLVLSKYQVPQEYLDAYFYATVGEHSALLCCSPSDYFAEDLYYWWDFDKNPINQNVNAARLSLEQLNSKIARAADDLKQITGKNFVARNTVLDLINEVGNRTTFYYSDIEYYFQSLILFEYLSEHEHQFPEIITVKGVILGFTSGLAHLRDSSIYLINMAVFEHEAVHGLYGD